MKSMLSVGCLLVSGLFWPGAVPAAAADFSGSVAMSEDGYRFTLEPVVGHYIGFQTTTNLAEPFTTAALALGDPAASYPLGPAPGIDALFVRAEAISLFAPRDSDRDEIDDLYELANGLDPLDPADAGKASRNLAGATNLEEYRLRFGLGSSKAQYYSREVSTFNFGAPSAGFEAISREQSVFNFGGFDPYEALGREISVFNGERPPVAGYPEGYSREVSLYNFGKPLFTVEALGRELTVFNGERPAIAGYPEVYSREVSAFNFGAPSAAIEAVSRELSILNDIQ